MKIKKEDREQIRQHIGAWAKTNKAKVREQDESFFIEKADWSIEVKPEDGWAYLHGNGSLNGISTNISSMDELGDAVTRLKGDK